MSTRSTVKPPFYENMIDAAQLVRAKWKGWFNDVDIAINGANSPPEVVTGSSPIAWTTGSKSIALVMISGGTGVSVTYSYDGSTFIPTGMTSGQVTVFPGDQLSITYTTIPTINAVYR